MNRTSLKMLAILAAGSASVACGGTDDKKSTGGAETPGDVAWTAAAMQSCKTPIHSPYLNDELCLEPPPADVGFQIYFGPGTDKNYDDPNALAPYVLAPGAGDGVMCVAATTPNDVESFSREHHVRTRSGTHHIIYWRSIDPTTSTIPADGTQAAECRSGLGTGNQSFFIGTESALSLAGGKLDAPLPAQDPTKYTAEEKGFAWKIPAKTRIWIETHFVNVSDKPMLREAWANVAYADSASVTKIIDPIFFISGLALNLPPGQSTVVQSSPVPRPTNIQGDLRFMALAGHAHAHTTRETAYITHNGVEQIVYQTYSWAEPLWAQFDGAHVNPPVKDGVDGSLSGPLIFYPGDTIRWECEVHNTTPDQYSPNPVTLAWGDLAYTGEMCNLFGYYTPGDGSMWSGG